MTEKFEVLTDREHCLHRPGVYIGSVTPEPQSAFFNYDVKTLQLSPGLLKIIYEILDNSVDEYIRTGGKFANKISVDIGTTLNGSNITISDNGRGIPQEILNGKPRPVWAWTELRAGSNFDDSKRVGAGTNGMGASLTNIFSREFIGTTCDGKNTLTVTCGNNMQEIDWKTRKGGTQGTSVEFLPDYERFQLADIDQFHIEAIEDRLNNMPYVCESLIIEQDGKLVALIYPDIENAQHSNISGHALETLMEENISTLNKELPAYSQISRLKIYYEEFEKTPKRSIKRYLYQSH
jgi:DNA topoisomerase-2